MAAILIVLFVSFLLSESVQMLLLHQYMTDSELIYYFQTNQIDAVPDYELVYFPKVNTTLVNLTFSAFERPLNLDLKKKSRLIPPHFKTYIHDESGSRLFNETRPVDCHYLYQDADISAALSICSQDAVQGLIFTDTATFQVQPLNSRLHQMVKRGGADSRQVPHLVRKAQFDGNFNDDIIFPTADTSIIWPFQDSTIDEIISSQRRRYRRTTTTIELALFFDEAAFKIFAPFFDYSEKKLQNMLLAYINGVQALYHHPSLGISLELVIVRLDIMKKQPKEMPHYNGERGSLLDSFCQYQASINPIDDNTNPDHWDMGLYVSGLDFYAYENGKKNTVTMGLATVGGVCLDQYACVIAEFGTTNVFGKPYPSAGFTSVYILAHEIGHNLGMHHDSSGNDCPKEGFIMSPSRGTNGETQWSRCSAKVMEKLDWAKCLKDSAQPIRDRNDHSRFLQVPGRIYTAKKQCEILLRDKDAVAVAGQQQSEICYNLQCKTPRRSGFYFAGPALEGTLCGKNQYCYGGYCTLSPPTLKPIKQVLGGWSGWKKGQCRSDCIENAVGVQQFTRKCNNPVPVNTDKGCEGVDKMYNLCPDHQICGNQRRKSINNFASTRCREFAALLLQQLDPKGVGLQAPHEDARVWTGCSIFCKRKDSNAFYSPRVELNDLGVSSYFPDGTWCHKDSTTNINYYCIRNHCLPENFKFTKILDDIPFPQNARLHELIPPSLKNYFSLNSKGNPIQTSFKTSDDFSVHEEEWETKDYIELPTIEKRFDALVHEMDDFTFL